MLRSLMLSGQLCDPNDPEEFAKLSKLRDLGIDLISGFITISRPYAVAPWVIRNGKPDISTHDERWWDHIALLADRCRTIGLGMVFQIINKWWIHEYGYPQSVAYGTPTGEYADALRKMLNRLTPIVNSLKLAAILPVTEGGSGSRSMCWFIRDTMMNAGLSSFVHWISNSGMASDGWIESPHPKTVAAWTKGRIVFGSTDGWKPSAAEWRKCVQYQKDAGASAIELWAGEFSGNPPGGAYAGRQRPSAAYIARTCGAQISETGR